MTRCNDSTGDLTVVPREEGISCVRDILRKAIIIEHRFTAKSLAAHTGIKLRRLESYMSETENVEAPFSVVLSILKVLGEGAVNDAVGSIGYVAQPVDTRHLRSPAKDAVAVLENVTRFTRCAIDDRIDHTEKPVCTEAADNVIELMAPYSSRGAQ